MGSLHFRLAILAVREGLPWRINMRTALTVLAGVALGAAPLSVSAAAPVEAAADSNCIVSLERASVSSGFQLERKCPKASPAKTGSSNLVVARAPLDGGSQIDGESTGMPVIVSLLALSAFVSGVAIAFRGADRPVSP
jgi:hypothetical protein